MYVWAMGDGKIRPCVDCGRRTGNFFETTDQTGHSLWQRGARVAADWMPCEL